MINQQLVDYIKSQIDKGVAKELITPGLVSQGWNTNDIDEAYLVIQNGAVPVQMAGISNGPEYLSNGKYFLFGMLGFCVMLVLMSMKYFGTLPPDLPVFVKPLILVSMILMFMLCIGVFKIFTNFMHMTSPSWSKAFFMFGLSPIFTAVIYTVVFFLATIAPVGVVLMAGIVLGVSLFFAWIYFAAKVYQVGFLKGFFLAILLNISIVISVFIFGFLSILVLDNLPRPAINTVEGTKKEITKDDTQTVPANTLPVTQNGLSSWQNYSDKVRGFQVMLPNTPTTRLTDKQEKVTIETIESTVGNFKYSIDYMDFKPNFYGAGDSVKTKEEKGVAFYLMVLGLLSGNDLKYSDAAPLDGHLTKSFTIDSPNVRFVGKVTAVDGKAYAYSTECDGAGCTNVPLQDEFLNSFSVIK